MEDHRQLVAILFADIQGYTSIMQADEKKGMTWLYKFKEAITKQSEQYGGKVVKTYGDGSLCLFPTSLGCLQCAMAIQEIMQHEPAVPLRIGLHEGDVIQRDGDVFGDAVNVVSRIESMGVSGNVLLSSSLFEKVKNRTEFNFTSLGFFHFKNVEDPMEVYALCNEGFQVPRRDELKGKFETSTNWRKMVLKALGPALFIGILTVAWVFYSGRLGPGTSGVNADRMSIAVLPFENKGDSGDAYFVEGISEDILTQLGKIGDIRVMSRFTISSYDITGKNPGEIGEELNVAYLLAGSVRRSGDELRISCQLIDTDKASEVWEEDYDREVDDLFMIQSEVAKRVADELHAKLSQQESQRIEKYPTRSILAYNLYLRGREEYYRYDPESNEQAIAYFLQALAEDREFALARAGLADAYSQGAYFYGNRSFDFLDSALNVARQAVSMDDESAETWKALGLVYSLKGNYTEARQCYRQSLDKNPSYDPAIDNLAIILHKEGNIADGAELKLKAIGINPLNAGAYGNLGNAFRIAGLYKEAIEKIKMAIQLDPDDWFYHFQLALTYMCQGDYHQAGQTVARMVSIGDSSSMVLEMASYITYLYDEDLAWEYLESIETRQDYDVRINYYVPVIKGYLAKVLGKNYDFDVILSERLAYHQGRLAAGSEDPDDFIVPSNIFCIQGDNANCLEWMERGLTANNTLDYMLYELDPIYEAVRGAERYQRLINRMKDRSAAERRKIVALRLND